VTAKGVAVLHGGGVGKERVGDLSRGAFIASVLIVAVVAVATAHPASAHRTVVHRAVVHAQSSAHVMSESTGAGLSGGATPAVGSTTAAPAAPAVPTVPTVPAVPALPPRGGATAYGCGPALAYLAAYAAPGFVFQCPGDAQGHQATTTCVSGASRCSIERLITIADPCAAAYMNEASNSFVVMGLSDAPIDPYGYCR
jgi:hypothetical protein